jgi:hypothetical protein
LAKASDGWLPLWQHKKNDPKKKKKKKKKKFSLKCCHRCLAFKI